MSWLFSQALVEAFLEGTCSDGEPSAPSNGQPTQLAYLSHGKTTDFSRLSRFGVTFRPLTDDRGEALLMSYREAFRARTSASPGKVTASTENARECGDTWRGWLARYDPVSCSWKTAQCSFLEDSTAFSLTLPRSGMTRAGLLWELPTLERPTSATASGLWPTPSANQFETKDLDAMLARRERAKLKSGNGNGFGLTLANAVRLWPTPVATMSKGSSPAALTRKDGRDRSGDRLDHAVMASDGGQLNPTWVEWLMGWPLGWTDLKPSATDRSRTAPPPLSDCSPLKEVA